MLLKNVIPKELSIIRSAILLLLGNKCVTCTFFFIPIYATMVVVALLWTLLQVSKTHIFHHTKILN
jgi:hypothetical protein